MKIVHIVESFSAGSFFFVSDLTKGMPEHEHIIIHGMRDDTPKDKERYFSTNTKFIPWPNATREINIYKDITALYGLIRILKQIHYIDVIHLHSSKAGFLGRVASRLIGLHRVVVFSPHAVSFLRKDLSRFKFSFYVLLEQLGSKLGGIVVASSKSEMAALNEYGIPSQLISNGYRHCEELPMVKAHDKIIIGTIGRITHQKNPQLFNKIAKNYIGNSHIKFIWIGDGELRELLSSDNIEVTGFVLKSHLDTLLRGIDCYLSTALWEGMSLSVLQAMSYSKPLVLSDCSGNRDVVVENYNGYIFRTLEQAILRINGLISDRENMKTFGRNSLRLLTEEFSLDKTISLYKELYGHLLQNSSQ